MIDHHLTLNITLSIFFIELYVHRKREADATDLQERLIFFSSNEMRVQRNFLLFNILFIVKKVTDLYKENLSNRYPLDQMVIFKGHSFCPQLRFSHFYFAYDIVRSDTSAAP